ncbi:MAG: DNA mismatch repair endonuclease MutL [Betaproteobacteria bacterium AqS2]|uniref:DNA mismatch repair protein MutL n=1 Tax=Candidatus Amphirhobacter heronislandensis TaxID=1732024 RepID=A0A930UGT4_9GAMM|nr:DNA mismatch repair endonuclease MutL [Betaproteobacteria bacterium AqS2]
MEGAKDGGLPRIKPLDRFTVSQIAAGEIVERPASALKELMENAIDSKPYSIEVAIEEGGFGSMTVRDDGCGIPKEDLEIAIKAHTTSKLVAMDDLETIATLGFRGEGLASIATLGRMRLRSRPAAQPAGAEIVAQDGELVEPVHDCVMAPGTEVSVTGLFANAPVRRRFMGQERGESSRCEALFQRLALTVPSIAMKLSINGREQSSMPQQEMSERLFGFYGKRFKDGAMAVKDSSGPLRIEGYINPDIRSSQTRQHLYINGRSVRERTVVLAIRKALADTARSPNVAFALFLTMPPAMLDVNAHPSKTEVRFKEGAPIFQFVYRAVKTQLVAKPLGINPDINFVRPLPPAPPNAEIFTRDEADYDSRTAAARSAPLPNPAVYPSSQPPAPPAPAAAPARPGGTPPNVLAPAAAPAAEEEFFPQRLGNVIGLLNGIYLLAESERGLILIDIHAAHERILYEGLKEDMERSENAVQPLLEEIELSLSPEELDVVERYRGHLTDCGLAICNIDGVEVLAGVPAQLAGQIEDYAGLVSDCLTDLGDAGAVFAVEEATNKALATIACHAALRGSQPFLSVEGQRELIRLMQTTPGSGRCNHGRPCWRTISFKELDAFFERGR